LILFILGHTGITLGVAGVAAGLEGGTSPDGLFTPALVIGANLPDLMNKPIGVFFPDLGLGTGRGLAHTLVFNLGLLATGWYLYAHGRPYLLYVALASIGHMSLDEMWRMPRVLLWPFYGFSFPRVGRRRFMPQILAWCQALRTHPGVYGFEAAGAMLILVYLWRYLLPSGSFLLKV